jgi:citrate lyase beta subunit
MPSQDRQPAASLTSGDLEPILSDLRALHAAIGQAFPGDPESRQPVHTVYGGAQLFRADTPRKLGALAIRALDAYAPDGAALAAALGMPDQTVESRRLADTVRARVAAKLLTEPVEDFRIDFEDGYGHRPGAEEDGHSASAAAEVAAAARQATLPPFIGIRVKPLSKDLHERSLRTLDLFVSTLAAQAGSSFPARLLVTLPKIAVPGQVSAAARACSLLERRLGLEPRTLRLELMIETPQSIVSADGTSPLGGLVAAADGRVTGVHFGAYDYTALCGITAAWQDVRHPACDFARRMMQASLAQTGVHLSDSVTTVLPVPVHRADAGRALTDDQHRENTVALHRAWKLHFDNVRQSLIDGFYQSWDLHPAQLPVRYAAVYDFFLSAHRSATARLRHFVEQATHATLADGVFDDAATGQGLLNFFTRGLACGALTLDEARETGLTVAELHGRSFLTIVENRRRPR